MILLMIQKVKFTGRMMSDPIKDEWGFPYDPRKPRSWEEIALNDQVNMNEEDQYEYEYIDECNSSAGNADECMCWRMRDWQSIELGCNDCGQNGPEQKHFYERNKYDIQTHKEPRTNPLAFLQMLQKECDNIKNEPGHLNHYGSCSDTCLCKERMTSQQLCEYAKTWDKSHLYYPVDRPIGASGLIMWEHSPNCFCKATERPLTPFESVVKEITLLHQKKSSDYGTGEDPYANIRGTQEFGIKPWVGAVVRAADKIVRLKQYVKKGRLVNESVEDSLLDLATYAIIALVMYREANE